MNENAINEWNIKIWCLKQLMKIYKKEKLIETKLFVSYKFTISKIHKNFTICVTRMRYEDQTHMPPDNLFPQPPHSGWGNTTQYTLTTSQF